MLVISAGEDLLQTSGPVSAMFSPQTFWTVPPMSSSSEVPKKKEKAEGLAWKMNFKSEVC